MLYQNQARAMSINIIVSYLTLYFKMKKKRVSVDFEPSLMFPGKV